MKMNLPKANVAGIRFQSCMSTYVLLEMSRLFESSSTLQALERADLPGTALSFHSVKQPSIYRLPRENT